MKKLYWHISKNKEDYNFDIPEKGRFKLFIKYLTIELYYPYIIWNNINKGISLDTKILIYIRNPERDWLMLWSGIIKILGFGFGLAWHHCQNPNCKNYSYK